MVDRVLKIQDIATFVLYIISTAAFVEHDLIKRFDIATVTFHSLN